MRHYPEPSPSRTAILLLASTVLSGCVAEGSFVYRGTVTQAEVASDSIDETPNPAHGKPVRNARLTLSLRTGAHCSEQLNKFDQYSDYDGSFELPSGPLAAFIFYDPDTEVLICVQHPDYVTYEYRTIFDKTHGPPSGDKQLNIRLRKR